MSEIYAAGAVVGGLSFIGLMSLAFSISRAGSKIANARRQSTARILEELNKPKSDGARTVDEMWKEGRDTNE
jgi:hypothetical protein